MFPTRRSPARVIRWRRSRDGERAAMPRTIKPTVRGVLRRQVLDQLAGIGDIHLALADDQWGTAQTLRRRYENCMRLLDDLGWREDDPADEFAITMDPLPLMRVLSRTRPVPYGAEQAVFRNARRKHLVLRYLRLCRVLTPNSSF
jgi:hypothetical protein